MLPIIQQGLWEFKQKHKQAPLYPAPVVVRKERLGVLHDHAAEQDQREQVRNGHQAVADIRRVPEQLDADERTGRRDEHVQNPVDLHPAGTEQEGKGGFAVGIPAQHGGEAEQDQRDRNDDLSDTAQILAEGGRCQHRAVCDAAVPVIQMSEYQDNKKTKDSDHSKRKSLMLGSIADLKLNTKKELNEDKTTITNKKMRARKSVMVNPLIGLSSFVKLKGQLTDISELIVQQEPDISEAICGCQQPNNYHIYTRERNGSLSYIYKLREFSGDCNRIFCPVNCREFTMKMKLMNEHSNKYDTNFNNSLMTMKRDWRIPCLCCLRPEIVIDLKKEKIRVGKVEQSFAFCDPCFTVYNENDEKIYYIEADCCQCGFICRNYSLGKTEDCQFLIYNWNNRDKAIGYIMKKTESVYSLADNYLVYFPSKIQPEDKFLLSIVAVMIDYQYYEKNNQVVK